MRKKTVVASAVLALAFSGLTSSAAFAGEVTGNGKKSGYSQGVSICKFSGLNDNPTSTNPFDPPGRVQSYGFSFVSQGLKAVVPSPGLACNPTSEFE
jgi:hypothetical protein